MGVNKDLIAYFRHLAERNTDLCGHFYRRNVEDILFKPKTDCEYPYLSLEKAEYDFNCNAGTCHKKRSVAFCVVDCRSRSATSEEELELVDKCEEIADEIIRKIRKDVEVGILNLIVGIDLNQISVVQLPFDSTSGNVGFRVLIELDQRFNKSINIEKWV